MKAVAIGLTAVLLTSGAGLAAPRQAYCYATVQASGGKLSRIFGSSCTIYITPVFNSEDSEYLLAAEFGQALPNAGLATCVTDQYDSELPAGRQSLIDGSKADHCAVSDQPPPAAPAPSEQNQ